MHAKSYESMHCQIIMWIGFKIASSETMISDVRNQLNLIVIIIWFGDTKLSLCRTLQNVILTQKCELMSPETIHKLP